MSQLQLCTTAARRLFCVAAQALADASAAASGGSSSGDDEPAFASSDGGDSSSGDSFELDPMFMGGSAAASPQGAVSAAGEADDRCAALAALCRQLRLTARRFEPPALLAALRSLAALAGSGVGDATAEGGGTAESAGSAASGADGACIPWVPPLEVIDALTADVATRHLRFRRLQRAEAAALLARLAAARGVQRGGIAALLEQAAL